MENRSPSAANAASAPAVHPGQASLGECVKVPAGPLFSRVPSREKHLQAREEADMAGCTVGGMVHGCIGGTVTGCMRGVVMRNSPASAPASRRETVEYGRSIGGTLSPGAHAAGGQSIGAGSIIAHQVVDANAFKMDVLREALAMRQRVVLAAQCMTFPGVAI